MRKPSFGIFDNKGVDQSVHSSSLIKTFVAHCIELTENQK